MKTPMPSLQSEGIGVEKNKTKTMKQNLQKTFKNLLLVITLLVTGNAAFAQVPLINSFSPQKGKYYDLDTINGTGFHTNVDSSFVFFGKVKANVISASATRLVVKVPRSAQSGLITVTKGGLTTKSKLPFMVYKEGGAYVDSSVISSGWYIGYVNASALMTENQLASGDFNLDNEIDVIETDTSAGSRIYLNNKTYQVYTTFSSYSILPDGTGNKIIGTADFNNDGKIDIISINKRFRKIYYFKNTSTTTAFNFSAPLIFNLQNSPRDFNINDFNNDGKLDLAITFDSIFFGTAGTSILLNVSTNIDSLLFSSPIAIGGNYEGLKILSTDFNLDGKQDLIVTPAITSQNQSIFLNNSTINTIAFIPINFGLSTTLKFHVGDFTSDGKPDIVFPNGNLTLYENLITGFTGSFSYYNTISVSSNFNLFVDINMDGLNDFILNNSSNGSTKIILQDKVLNYLNKKDFTLSSFLTNGIYLSNSFVLADLDTNYSQDLISYASGLRLSRNDFYKKQPTIKSTNANVILLESFQAKVKVNKGNGSNRIIILKKGSAITQLPTDYINYLAKDSFGLGTLIEPDCYVMYIGNKDTFTFNNLRRNTRYYAAVIEFNGLGLGANFMDSAFNFDFQTKNQISLPTTNVIVSQISDSSARISWTKGDGTHRLVIATRDAQILGPTQFKPYRADNNFNYGDTLLDQYRNIDYVVYADTGSYLYLNELSVSERYYIKIFEYEIKNDSIFYSNLTIPGGTFFYTPRKMPRIDSIVPIKAKPGDKVTIYGDNFDIDRLKNKVSYLLATNSNDISMAVTFGLIRASEINIINKRIIEAIVPYGATNDFVRVTRQSVGDSYSPKKFQPYFISRDTFGAGTYGSNTIGIGWNGLSDSLNGIGIADLDGNGKIRFLIQSGGGLMRTYGPFVYSENYQLNTDMLTGQYISYSPSLTSNRTIESNFDENFNLHSDYVASSLSSWQANSRKPVLGATDFNKDGKHDFLVIDANYNNPLNDRSIGVDIKQFSYIDWETGNTVTGNPSYLNWNTGNQLLRAAAINDFNNDGKPDIISANYITGKIRLFKNVYDTGEFNLSSFDTTLVLSGPAGWERLESADINEDGKEDFAITNSINNKLYIYKNVSSGVNLDSNSFVIAAIFSLPCKPNRVKLQDVTGDGKIDLIVSGNKSNGQGIIIYKNNSINKNIDTNSFKSCYTLHNSNGGDLKIADVTLDGKPEIIYNSYSSSGIVIVNSTQKIFTISQLQKPYYYQGDTFRLPYNTFGRSFNTGNICKVQLLDATGNNIVNANIGQKTSTLSADTLLCTLPISLPFGSYKLRVVSTSVADTSTTTEFNISICQRGLITNITSSKGLSICSYDSIDLVAGTNSSGNFKWYKNNQLIAINNNNNLLSVRLPGLYSVNYTSSSGCPNPSNTVQVTTFNNSFSGYNYSNSLTFCVGDSVKVTANSTHPNYKTTWYFNNNLLQADTFSNITIKQSGNYNAIIKDTNFCSWVAPTFTVNNNDYKVKILTNKPLAFCNGDSTLLIADSLGNAGLKWKWFLNNLPLSDSTNTLKIFTTGIYKLKATNTIGCIKFSNDTQITVYPKPTVNFYINNLGQCLTGNQFTFTDSSTISSGTISRKWNLGTGINDTSLLASLSKVYSAANTYSIKLVETSNNNCKDSLTKTITVFPQPKAGFTINKNSQCLYNNSFMFMDTTTNTTSLWKTGVGNNQTTKTINQSYNNIGNYSVKLVVKSVNNCLDSTTKTIDVNPQPTAGFTINSPIQCLTGNNFLFADTSKISIGTITRKWNFGMSNNDTSSLANPNKSYSIANTYSVKLIVTSNNNCKDTLIKTVTINPKPTANFTINSNSQCLKNNNFLFTNQSTPGFNYLWKFGNGDTTNTVSPNYSYANAGTNSVKLIVSDNKNCKDSISKNIIVNPNAKPNFTINKDTQNLVGNNFIFTNTSTNSTYQTWNFGDLTTSTLLSPSKSFTSFGTKTIKLIGNNAANCPDTINKSVFVNARPSIGNILGNANPTSLITPYSYSVLSQANIVYNWSAINGTIQTGQGTNAITVVWNSTGTGNLNAKITNNYNLSDSTNLVVNITTVGVNNLSLNNDLKVYPNPTKISITISNKNNLVGKKYIITNLVGHTVLSGKLNLDETIVNLETLQSGMYFLSLDGMSKQSIKIIKQ